MTQDKSDEIRALNLTYLLLAQRMLKSDRAGAMLLLGLSDELADLLSTMSLPQTLKLAASNLMLCSFRLGHLKVAKSLVGSDKKEPALLQAHLSIVLAGAAIEKPRAAASAWA